MIGSDPNTILNVTVNHHEASGGLVQEVSQVIPTTHGLKGEVHEAHVLSHGVSYISAITENDQSSFHICLFAKDSGLCGESGSPLAGYWLCSFLFNHSVRSYYTYRRNASSDFK